MKMKRTIKIALCAGVILAVAACFLVCGISEGTYRMVTEDGSGNAPAIHFDMSGEKIRFVIRVHRDCPAGRKGQAAGG